MIININKMANLIQRLLKHEVIQKKNIDISIKQHLFHTQNSIKMYREILEEIQLSVFVNGIPTPRDEQEILINILNKEIINEAINLRSLIKKL